MMTLIYGGSASGKSSFAEKMAMELSGEGQRYYIATMQVYGEEGRQRVQRHVRLRAGKGFQTIECPTDIADSLKQIPDPSEAVILIECVSNLAANEMFDGRFASEDIFERRKIIVRKVTEEIRILCRQVKNAVVVTNNIFEDGAEYAEETMQYLHGLGQINRILAADADTIIEVAAGIPVCLTDQHRYNEYEAAGAAKEEPMEHLHLVIGGRAQGKMDYVRQCLQSKKINYLRIDGNETDLCVKKANAEVLVLDRLQDLIQRVPDEETVRRFLGELLDQCRSSGRELIIICDEVGNGVVPANREERDYRERVGRILCDLARDAGRVERVVMGIPCSLRAATGCATMNLQ